MGKAGVVMVGTALLLNEWVLTALFSSGGSIDSANRVLIWLFGAVLASFGLALIALRRRLRWRHIVALCLGIAVGLVLCEVALRIMAALTKWQPPVLVHANPHGTGSYRLLPNLDLEYFYGDALVRIGTNGHGMRWRRVDRI